MKDGHKKQCPSDEEILTLYNCRDEQAITATQRKYGAYCHAIADRILHVREDAEECVSDAYLHTWNAIPPAQPGSLRAFLGTVVRNLAINRLDYNRRGGAVRRPSPWTSSPDVCRTAPSR